MRRLGKVLHLSKSSNLIVRLESSLPPPQVGAEVYNQKIEKVGIVNNILGPVRAPYASVTPTDDARPVVGKTVYLFDKQ